MNGNFHYQPTTRRAARVSLCMWGIAGLAKDRPLSGRTTG